MAILSSSGIYSFLCSCKKMAGEYLEHFKSGFAGYGWKIWERWPGKWCFEIDDMVVRGKMTVFDMTVSKIRFIRGALGITQANGTVKAVADMEDSFKLAIDEEMSFVADDFIKCKQFSNGAHGYHVKVDRIEGNMIVILKSEFNKDADGNVSDPPRVGDELVQFGNETDQARQSAIYLHADEGGQPSIDVMFGLKSKDWTGCVKISLGGSIPGYEGFNGFYCENGMVLSVDEKKEVIYKFSPDGSFSLGRGKISYNPKTDKINMKGITLDWGEIENAPIPEPGKDGAPGKDGEIGGDGAPGKDANLLTWVQEYEDSKTLINGEHVISPKMFSGTSRIDESSKQWLTGVAMGRDCITTDPDGTKRTGIFAVVDNEVVFELDPMTKKYLFKGRIEADEGYISGNVEIDGELISKVISATNITTGKITITDGASIGDFKVDGGGLTCENTPALIGLKYANNSLELGAGGVHIKKMNEGYAFRITGAVGWVDMDVASIRITSEDYEFIQRDGGRWNVPGVLWCGAYACPDWNPILTRSWGDGLGGEVPSISRSKKGCYTITHNLKHTDYYIHAIGSAQIRTDYLWWNTTCGFINVNSNSFTLQFKDDGGNENDPSEFQVMIFGRNKIQ